MHVSCCHASQGVPLRHRQEVAIAPPLLGRSKCHWRFTKAYLLILNLGPMLSALCFGPHLAHLHNLCSSYCRIIKIFGLHIIIHSGWHKTLVLSGAQPDSRQTNDTGRCDTNRRTEKCVRHTVCVPFIGLFTARLEKKTRIFWHVTSGKEIKKWWFVSRTETEKKMMKKKLDCCRKTWTDIFVFLLGMILYLSRGNLICIINGWKQHHPECRMGTQFSTENSNFTKAERRAGPFQFFRYARRMLKVDLVKVSISFGDEEFVSSNGIKVKRFGHCWLWLMIGIFVQWQ